MDNLSYQLLRKKQEKQHNPEFLTQIGGWKGKRKHIPLNKYFEIFYRPSSHSKGINLSNFLFDQRANLNCNQIQTSSFKKTPESETITDFSPNLSSYSHSWGIQALAHNPSFHSFEQNATDLLEELPELTVLTGTYCQWKALQDIPSPEKPLDFVESAAMSVSCNKVTPEEQNLLYASLYLQQSCLRQDSLDTLTNGTLPVQDTSPSTNKSSLQQLDEAFHMITTRLMREF